MNTPARNTENLNIDICMCTFRREHVTKTLASLSRLTLRPNWAVRIIVADNDDTASARVPVETAAREWGLTLTYLHAPARNISVARNACLNKSQASLVAFVDDDEIVSPGWLEALVAEYYKSRADVILGQVKSIYGPECPEWMRQGDMHGPKPVWVKNEIRTGYTCNVLFDPKAPSIHGRRFREELGQSGGEDTIFFSAVFRAGGRFSYAPNAVVTEDVLSNRARFAWLLKRYFRIGQTHGVVLLEEYGTTSVARAKGTITALAKAAFCFAGAVITIINAVHVRYWVLRGVMHLGVAARLLGLREIKQYG